MSSGSQILLTITLGLKMIIYNISWRFVGIVLIDVSLSNIFLYMLLL